MNDYYEVRVDITPCTEDATDYMAALLADAGYESFVPDTTGLTAYVKDSAYSEQAIADALAELPFECHTEWHATLVPGQDWNAEWEKNYFEPIVVAGDQCVIHSSFHTGYPACRYDITIDPKMAFGTGHHSTTSLIIETLLKLDLAGKSLTDVGTGTGILAILAAMRGAAPVNAIEIDGFAYENAVDNVKINNHAEINVIHGDASALAALPQADYLVANINRNIITADMPAYAAALKTGGTMLLSGFYEDDVPVVWQAAEQAGLTPAKQIAKPDHWACLIAVKDVDKI